MMQGKKRAYVHKPTYNSWAAMKRRCSAPSVQASRPAYAKGLSLEPSWRTYENFLADMGERPDGFSLERKDNNKGYCKANCIWASARTQANNRSSNTNITWKGKTQTLSQWARELGLNRGTVAGRVSRYGYNPEIIFAPASSLRSGANPLSKARLLEKNCAQDAD